MLVRDWMSKPAITIGTETSIQDAVRLLKKHDIGILPVVEDDRIVGVLTDSDLKKESSPDATSSDHNEFAERLQRVKVKKVMTKHPLTVSNDLTVEEAAGTFLVHNISAAPVVNQLGQPVGIISVMDLFKVFIALAGVGKKGLQIGLKLIDHSGAIKEVTDVIRGYGGRVASILSTRDWVSRGYLKVYIRAYGLDQPTLERIKKVIEQNATVLYIIDHEGKTREIYEEDLSLGNLKKFCSRLIFRSHPKRSCRMFRW